MPIFLSDGGSTYVDQGFFGSWTTVSVPGTYVLTSSEFNVLVLNSAATATVTLPTPVGNAGKTYTIALNNGNNISVVTINTAGGASLGLPGGTNSATSFVFDSKSYKTVRFKSTGAEYVLVDLVPGIKPYILAFPSNAQTLANNGVATLANWTKTQDVTNIMNATTGVITIAQRGVYTVNFNATTTNGAWALNSELNVGCNVNGSSVFANSQFAQVAFNSFFSAPINGTLLLAAGDLVTFTVFQSSGTAKTPYTSGVFSRLMMTLVG